MQAMIAVFAALLADNLVMSRLLGSESFFTFTGKPSAAAAYGGCVTLVTVLSGAVSLALYKFVFLPLKIEFMATFVTVLIIAAVVFGIHFASKVLPEKLRTVFAVNMPIISTNCVVIGAIMLCIEKSLSFGVSLLYLLFAGAGFTLAVLVFGSVRERLKMSDPPIAFRGLPILLLSASFAAMAFAGFFGLSF